MLTLTYKVLYKRDARGAMRVWRIAQRGNEIIIEHGQLGGAMSQKREYIEYGKAGRSRQQQLESRMDSRVNLQKDKGYVESLDEAKSNDPTNTLGFQLPMLAQRYDRVSIGDDYFVQYKLDGNRCLLVKQNDEVFAYTRQGKLNPNLDHIVQAARHIPNGTVLDGELYAHGVPLQTIRSWVSRKQPDTEKLRFHCYDLIDAAGYAQRAEALSQLTLGNPIDLVPNVRLRGAEAAPEALSKLMSQAIGEGYEGLMLRDPEIGYEPGKRSKSLIKLKKGMMSEVPMDEEEFVIIDVLQSRDGWAILVCQMENGSTFKVSAPGDMGAKYKAWAERDTLIGKDATVEFAGRTKYGTPFHPVALAIRAGD